MPGVAVGHWAHAAQPPLTAHQASVAASPFGAPPGGGHVPPQMGPFMVPSPPAGMTSEEAPPNEMADAAAQWARHSAYTSSRAAQAAEYAAQQAKSATQSAQNAVAQMTYLMGTREAAVGMFGLAAAAAKLTPARPRTGGRGQCDRYTAGRRRPRLALYCPWEFL
mmetsp:Transcript_48598/g.141575  ORF Transcript_48598/g.141575 Transcript_48598/m.141575 type:complete len:165 (-) Transcript_48598:132-626(-)